MLVTQATDYADVAVKPLNHLQLETANEVASNLGSPSRWVDFKARRVVKINRHFLSVAGDADAVALHDGPDVSVRFQGREIPNVGWNLSTGFDLAQRGN